MGKLTTTALFLLGIGAGFAAGHYHSKATPEKCAVQYTAEMEEKFGPSLAGYKTFLENKVSEIQKQFSEVPVPAGVAQPKDLSLEYVVSPKEEFQGILFMDFRSDREGFVGVSEGYGGSTLHLRYDHVDKIRQSAEAAAPLPLNIQIYRGEKKE